MTTKESQITVFTHRCERCEHGWESRTARPRVCPACHSAWWDTPRRITRAASVARAFAAVKGETK